jgi:hypothetical protein
VSDYNQHSFACHAERGEDGASERAEMGTPQRWGEAPSGASQSSRRCACDLASDGPTGFFAALLMNRLVCHSERSEESSRMLACSRAAGFFAKPQNDKKELKYVS